MLLNLITLGRKIHLDKAHYCAAKIHPVVNFRLALLRLKANSRKSTTGFTTGFLTNTGEGVYCRQ
ncbi:MAG: hypothetical protein UT41_C0001G0485 [Candidatus Wolfebacteria bacterium GW2011_GWC2_39_22]|uniref:Uncharacterized protein n=1 Tax=Candidatus Wolfebacteria bacterium GW2011_GWC2_39_22 TaxID=1619013 RepID=A0A0G0NJC0_9BACT|nr:MAG: hypothetical protein UT41_C0001G0485 [Candidatus Wolfebacteria bacterium GW2011_GWC2_39_22]